MSEIYKDIISIYLEEKFDTKWIMRDGIDIMIKDMEDSHIRNCINMMSGSFLNDSRRAWIYIFEDVQLKRRALKIERIKNKLKEIS